MSILSWILDSFLPDDEDEFDQRAKDDQRFADHPGCERGFMECRSITCGCRESRPSPKFVSARAEILRRDDMINSVMFRSTRGGDNDRS